jgi:hypothetical protein
MMNFLELPKDIQNKILVECGFNNATYEVFPDHYRSLLTQECCMQQQIITKIIRDADTASLITLVKEGFLDESLLLKSFTHITWDVDYISGLSMLVALAAVLRWHNVGIYVTQQIDRIGVWNIRSLPSDNLQF